MRIAVVVLAVAVLGSIAVAGAPQGEPVSVSGRVTVVRQGKSPADNRGVAIWLKPVVEAGQRSSEPPLPRLRLEIVQRNKRFEPRFLVAPVGAVVEFPNLDPFFHNVFSLFDGKRFDLGLYEAGTSRSVPFSKPGACYIFCNIHPEMSAIVLIVDTPYYAVSNAAGEFTMPNVPPGRYLLSVWHDRFKPERPGDFPREVRISQTSATIGAVRLVESDQVIVPHTNKYGHEYKPPPSSPIYKGR